MQWIIISMICFYWIAIDGSILVECVAENYCIVNLWSSYRMKSLATYYSIGQCPKNSASAAYSPSWRIKRSDCVEFWAESILHNNQSCLFCCFVPQLFLFSASSEARWWMEGGIHLKIATTHAHSIQMYTSSLASFCKILHLTLNRSTPTQITTLSFQPTRCQAKPEARTELFHSTGASSKLQYH